MTAEKYKKKLAKYRKVSALCAGSLYDQVKLGVDLYNDPFFDKQFPDEYAKEVELSKGLRMFNIFTEYKGFYEFRQMIERFPIRRNWVDGDLGKMWRLLYKEQSIKMKPATKKPREANWIDWKQRFQNERKDKLAALKKLAKVERQNVTLRIKLAEMREQALTA